jgi:hypothetical protein
VHIFLAVFAAIIAAGIVLQALAGEPATRRLLRSTLNLLGIGMVVIVGLVIVLYLANVSQHHAPLAQTPKSPVEMSTAYTVIFGGVLIAFMTGLVLLTVAVVIARIVHEFRVPHVHTRLGYSSGDAAFCEKPSRIYSRLGY